MRRTAQSAETIRAAPKAMESRIASGTSDQSEIAALRERHASSDKSMVMPKSERPVIQQPRRKLRGS